MLLAALPATPVQLAHACNQVGYEVVVPASWGDELVAHSVLEDLRERGRDPVIQCTCPLVAERLLANGQHLAPSMVQTASPPVAAARYARHAFSPRTVRITYIGACPAARNTAIDARYLPDEFLQLLRDQDVTVSDMPTVFDSVLPPDRRRFVSLPGGCPTQEALWQSTEGRMLREVTQPTFSADLAQTLVWREHVMIDVAPSLGCACAGSHSRLGVRCGRVAVMAVEPPRAGHPVVAFQSEFTAPITEPSHVAESNGDAPVGAEDADDTPSTARSGAQPVSSVSHARARRSDMPLPRAYLAKRRHVQPAPRSRTTPRAEVEGVVSPSKSGSPLATEHVQPEPNDAPDVARPIEVHVEPEPGQAREDAPEATATGEEVLLPAISGAPAHEQHVGLVLELKPEVQTQHVAVAEQAVGTEEGEDSAQDAEKVGPPSEVVLDEPVSSFEPPSGPLRVEVEIFEEGEVADIEVIVPDAVRSYETLKPPHPVPEIVTRPVRPWGDLMIAVWLVLVVSAVLAALVWR